MRPLLALLLLAGAGAAAPPWTAADYFETGLAYLRAGLYSRARAAFAESLERAPDQPVPTAFLGIAAAAERRPARECAAILRRALELLPAGKGMLLDLRAHLPSARSLALLLADYPAAGPRDSLAVRAFLEVMDGTPADAPALAALRAAAPEDRYAAALERISRTRPPPPSPPASRDSSGTTPPTASARPGAVSAASPGRTRT